MFLWQFEYTNTGVVTACSFAPIKQHHHENAKVPVVGRGPLTTHYEDRRLLHARYVRCSLLKDLRDKLDTVTQYILSPYSSSASLPLKSWENIFISHCHMAVLEKGHQVSAWSCWVVRFRLPMNTFGLLGQGWLGMDLNLGCYSHCHWL